MKHRTERDDCGHVLPALIFGDIKIWYYCGLRHRECRDARGRVLPAEIVERANKTWWQNHTQHHTDHDEHGQLLPTMIMLYGDETV